MAATAEKIEELEVPNGGIGDFVMEDDEAEAVYGKDEESEDDEDEDDEEFGETGIAQFPDIAKKMATYGRNEDKLLAHVAKGELVIPFQFLENEDTKKVIFDMLIEAGLEDPERYVVGGESNSINPTTGLPEFFLGKIFRGIVGGVKKALSGVVKVIKKIAPIVLPIALSFTPLGPMFGAAMGSGIATLINGGDLGDAMKSGLMAGAAGAVTAGFTGTSGSFMQNIKAAADPARFSQALEGVTGDRAFFSKFNPTEGIKPTTADFKFDPKNLEGQQLSSQQLSGNTSPLNLEGQQLSSQQLGGNPPPESINRAANLKGSQLSSQQLAGNTFTPTPPKPELSFLDKPLGEQYGIAKDYMFRGGETKAGVLEAQKAAGKAAYDAGIAANMGEVGAQAYAKSAFEDAAPGMLAKYGPSVLAGTAIAAGAGAFKVPEQEPVNLAGRNPDGTVITGSDLIDADPSKYLIGELGNLRLNPETGEYEEVESMVSSFNKNTRPFEDIYATTPMPNNMGRAPSGPFARPYVQAAADGGPIFPRRNGGIAPTEGVQGQDSVRAMLMPGEFVMTTDAVRGLGNGNLNSGIQNMYSVMRNLESRGRNTA